jgi:hypothetical protein
MFTELYILPHAPLNGRFCPLFLYAKGKPSVSHTFRSTITLYSMFDAQLFLPPHRNVRYHGRLARFPVSSRIAGLKRDGPCAETRFRLSEKKTSPFESAGGVSVVSL